MSSSDKLRRNAADRVSAGLDALAENDPGKLRSTLTDDVELLLPDRPTLRGSEVVARTLLEDGAPGAEVEAVDVSGGLGFVRWRRTTASREPRRGLCVVLRDDAGEWRISRWIENRGREPGSVPVAGVGEIETPSGPGFRVSLLGHPRVTVVADLAAAAGELEVRWPFQRALEILAFLTLAPQYEAARDELIEAIWDEEGEETVEKNFHPTVSHVRGALSRAWKEVFGETLSRPVVYEGGLYRLHGEVGWWVDVAEMELLLARGRRRLEEGDVEGALSCWERGRDLHRGSLLQGVYTPWTNLPRDRIHRTYLELLEELARAYANLDRLTQAMDSYRRLLFEDPLRERVHVALMQIYARQGRRDLVRRQYDRLTALLQEELGVQPLPQTTEEYHRVMG